VLAVLQRESAAPDVVSSERPLHIRAPELSLEGERFRLRSAEADVAVQQARVVGHDWRFVTSTLKVVGALMSSVFDRVTHFSKHHLRTTEGTDRVQAAHVECEASQLLRLSGEHTLINGDKLVKARGSQIHFG
jgi:hypothetical protein